MGVYALTGPAVGAAFVFPVAMGMAMVRGDVELPGIFVTALLAGYLGGLEYPYWIK